MAMLQMQRIFIYALKKDRKKVLELLQLRGVVEINDNNISEDNVFTKTDIASYRSRFEKNISTAKDALDILNRYAPVNKSKLSILRGREEVSTKVYDAFREKYEDICRIAFRINALMKEIAEKKADILKLQTQMEMLTPWTSLDIPMDYSGTKYTKAYIGTLPNAWTLDAIYEKLALYTPINVDIISSTKDQTCIFVICKKDMADKVYETIRSMDFSYPSITYDKSPVDQLVELKHEISDAISDVENDENEIISYEKYRDDLLFLQDYDLMRSEKYEAIGELLQSKNVFILSGYIPKKEGKALEEELNSKFDISVEIKNPSKKDEVPIMFKNNAFSAPLESVVTAYSPPGKNEVDPTMVMSLFYYLLFGLMLSDAGYGALMVSVCAFVLIKFGKVMEYSIKKTMRMYLFCGMATMFWGVMFGSYFGDIVDVVSESFFVNKISIVPIWFFPVKDPMRMLSFAMLLGIIHLFAGLAMQAYQLIKQKNYVAVIYDVLFWYGLLGGLIVLLLSMKMITDILGITMIIPIWLINTGKVVAILSAIGIILTNGRESKNVFKRFLKGLYALYGVSGYLSDVLSYSRLLALGLATGVIATVINQMASMTADMFLGPLFFIIILIIGHVINFGINALGAYVHTNRLQYVEFFSKFYEGGGHLFKPFGINTKYYKFKE